MATEPQQQQMSPEQIYANLFMESLKEKIAGLINENAQLSAQLKLQIMQIQGLQQQLLEAKEDLEAPSEDDKPSAEVVSVPEMKKKD